MVIMKLWGIFGKWLQPSAVLVKNKEILFLLGLLVWLSGGKKHFHKLCLKINDHMAISCVRVTLHWHSAINNIAAPQTLPPGGRLQ